MPNGTVGFKILRVASRDLPECGAPNAQDLGNGPSLRDAAARREWRLCVEDLAERAQAVRDDLFAERLKEPQGCFAVAIHAEMGEDEGSQEPPPHSTLMVGTIPFPGAAAVMGLVA